MSEEEIQRQVANELTKLQPTISNIVVTQAVIAALILSHPNPDLVRKLAESLLMQGQAKLAITSGQFPQLTPAQIHAVLDFFFRPAVQLDLD